MGLAGALPEPVAPLHERGKGRGAGQEQMQGLRKAAGVGHQVPIARHAAKALDRLEVHAGIAQQGVGRLAVIDHAGRLGVPGDRRAPQALEQAQLNLMRAQCVEPVKTRREALQCLAGQAKDQVGMHMGPAVGQQPAQVVCGALVVLSARDGLLHLGVEALYAHFKLQRALGELNDQALELIGQLVRHQFEVHKHLAAFGQAAVRLAHAVEEELQDPAGLIDAQIEGAVDKLEVACPPVPQRAQFGQKALQLERPGGLVQGAEAKLAPIRAAPRSLHVQQALGQITRAVFGIGQGQLRQRRLLASDDLHQGRRSIEQGPTQARETHIAPAGDHVVGQLANFLLIDLVADLGPAQHDANLGCQGLEQAHQLQAGHRIPDVDPQTNHLRLERQQLFGHLYRLLRQGEFTQHGLRPQTGPTMAVQVGQQATQAQRGMDETGVDRAQHDARRLGSRNGRGAGGHRAIIRAAPEGARPAGARPRKLTGRCEKVSI